MSFGNFFLCVFIVFCVERDILAVHRFAGVTICEFEEDCDQLKNATCIDDYCQCNGSRICERKIIRMVTKIGLDCEQNRDCNIEHSECRNGECTCRDGYTSTDERKRCLKISEGLDSECEENVQCYMKVEKSGCQDKKCVCQQGMHVYDGSCYPDTELDQKCVEDGDCSGTHFAECTKSKCTCMEKYVKVPTTRTPICLPVAEKLNDTCIYDVQCTSSFGTESACIGGFCSCKEMYQLKKNINKCVRDMMLNDLCVNHSDCRQPFDKEHRLECVMGVCKCRSFYKEIDGLCMNKASTRHFQAVSTTVVIIFVIFRCFNFF